MKHNYILITLLLYSIFDFEPAQSAEIKKESQSEPSDDEVTKSKSEPWQVIEDEEAIEEIKNKREIDLHLIDKGIQKIVQIYQKKRKVKLNEIMNHIKGTIPSYQQRDLSVVENVLKELIDVLQKEYKKVSKNNLSKYLKELKTYLVHFPSVDEDKNNILNGLFSGHLSDQVRLKKENQNIMKTLMRAWEIQAAPFSNQSTRASTPTYNSITSLSSANPKTSLLHFQNYDNIPPNGRGMYNVSHGQQTSISNTPPRQNSFPYYGQGYQSAPSQVNISSPSYHNAIPSMLGSPYHGGDTFLFQKEKSAPPQLNFSTQYQNNDDITPLHYRNNTQSSADYANAFDNFAQLKLGNMHSIHKSRPAQNDMKGQPLGPPNSDKENENSTPMETPTPNAHKDPEQILAAGTQRMDSSPNVKPIPIFTKGAQSPIWSKGKVEPQPSPKKRAKSVSFLANQHENEMDSIQKESPKKRNYSKKKTTKSQSMVSNHSQKEKKIKTRSPKKKKRIYKKFNRSKSIVSSDRSRLKRLKVRSPKKKGSKIKKNKLHARSNSFTSTSNLKAKMLKKRGHQYTESIIDKDFFKKAGLFPLKDGVGDKEDATIQTYKPLEIPKDKVQNSPQIEIKDNPLEDESMDESQKRSQGYSPSKVGGAILLSGGLGALSATTIKKRKNPPSQKKKQTKNQPRQQTPKGTVAQQKKEIKIVMPERNDTTKKS